MESPQQPKRRMMCDMVQSRPRAHQAQKPAPQPTVQRQEPRPEPVRPPQPAPESTHAEAPTPRPHRRRRKRKPVKLPSWLAPFVGVTVLVLGLIAAGMWVFGGANITITPLVITIPEGTTFTATQNPTSGQGLAFSLLAIDDSVEQEIEITTKQYVEEFASGEVILYNNHSSSPVTIGGDTQLLSAKGQEFKLADSADIIIPGATIANGKAVPGSITATLTATKPGKKSNIQPGRLVLGTSQNEEAPEGIWAENVLPFGGGFMGDKAVMTDNQRKIQYAEATTLLRDKLLARIEAQEYDKFVMLRDQPFVELSPVVESTIGNRVVLRQEGTASIVLLPRADLQRYLITTNNNLSDEEKNATYTWPTADLEAWLTITKPVDRLDLLTQSISLKTNKAQDMIADINPADIASSIKGLAQEQFQNSVDSITEIQTAELTLHPFWREAIPAKKDPNIMIQRIYQTANLSNLQPGA